MNDSPIGNASEAFRVALEQRAFEISQLTNRNNFFMVFQGVLLAGLIQSQGAAPGVMNFFICIAGMGMSLYQAAMAGGAKYWQIRWEVAVKRIESMLLENLQSERLVIQLFTSDMSHLTKDEQDKITRINASGQARKADPLNVKHDFVRDLVVNDLAGGKSWPAMRWIIRQGFSVSRIPIAVGIMLFCVWAAIWINTFAIGGKTPWAWIASLTGSNNILSFVMFAK